MKTVGKIIKIIGGIVIVLLILIVAGFYIFGERALKVGVEVAATKALGVGVTIDDVALSLLRGSVGIEGLIVNNPPGYEYDNLLELNSTKVKVNVGELLGETAHIKDIKLDGINLVIEQKGLTN
ncbi:MAG TPA: AsmA family protein, partial [Desulfobacterales bacterium]|nr:AsmA family protein [Desulfobacterales bacterium]